MKTAVLAATAMAALASTTGVAQAVPRTLVVDDDGIQCPTATYQDIQFAEIDAAPGDTIRVCPGTYRGEIGVDKRLTIQASRKPSLASCFTPAPADPATQAVVHGFDIGFLLQADDITLSGFVIEGSSREGIFTSSTSSGYKIRDNLLQNNGDHGPLAGAQAGIQLGSSGTKPTEVAHNCLRENGIKGLEAGGALSNAKIKDNRTFHNGSPIDVGGIAFDLGPGGLKSRITLEHNTSRDEISTVFLRDAVDSRISGNTIEAGTGRPIETRGDTTRLKITNNDIGPGTADGMYLASLASTGVTISGNHVEGRGERGIHVTFGALKGAKIMSNRLFGNALEGLLLEQSNTGNLVATNTSSRNQGDGIHAAGATGNTFRDNTMLDNGGLDAQDNDFPSNTWRNNHCRTDIPPGQICTKPR